MANGRFAILAKRFAIVVDDSRDGGSEIAKKYSLAGRRSYFLVLDSEGKELGRYGTYKKFEFDDKVVAIIESIEAKYRRSQTKVLDYLLTWIDSDEIAPSRFKQLVSELNSPKYGTRESASNALVSLGEPAYQFLSNYESRGAESDSRVFSIVNQLKHRHDVIIRNGLDHDISYLAKYAEQHSVVEDYLKRIMPPNVAAIDIPTWWTENRDRYKWDVDSRKFVLSERSLEQE